MNISSQKAGFSGLGKGDARVAASILIVDEHEMLRAGIKLLLSAPGSSMVVGGEASNASQALELLLLGEWNLIVLDTVLPDQNGLDFIRKIKGLYPSLPVLVFTGNRSDCARAFRAGASGYITKDASGVELVAAFRTLIAGGTWVGESVPVRSSCEEDSAELHGRLSPREREVMEMILSGQRPKEIACQLNVSIKTVSTHRTRLMKKLGVDDSLSLIRYAIRHQLTPDGAESFD